MRTARTWTTSLVTLLFMTLAGGCGDDDPVQVQTPPSPPTDVTATLNGDGTITVTWNASDDADAYEVQRNWVEGAGSFQSVASDVMSTSYTDSDVLAGNTYQYRVIATNEEGSSGFSDIAETFVGVRLQGGGDDVASGETLTLSASTTYVLEGILKVEEGGTLVIEPGTTVLGSTTVAPTALFVLRGGRIEARGTESAPIVFTSGAPAGQRAAGDWGGVVIHGRSICNFADRPCIGEGGSGAYGPDEGEEPVLDDDSGFLEYVRIEFAGFEVSFGNELNALTMNGVGNGTTMHHIQTHRGLDDGFEWFGGTVDLKYALATQISDDSFDFSTGWQGRGQFWIAQQDPNDADTGYEVDGNEADHTRTPLTDPLVYNVTLVGKQPGTGVSGESTRGMILRRGTAGRYHNHVILGFETGLDIDDVATYAHCDTGALVISASIFWNNGVFLDAADDDETSCTSLAGWDLRQEDPMLADPFNLSAPDFTPQAGSPVLTDPDEPPADGFFEAVDFIGGADPDGPAWWTGWTTFAGS